MKAVPTPRTDRECDDYAGPLCWIGGTQFIPADFARTLERELASAQAALAAKDAEIARLKSDGAASAFVDMAIRAEKAEAELARVINRRDILAEQITALDSTVAEFSKQNSELHAERDQLRAEAEMLKQSHAAIYLALGSQQADHTQWPQEIKQLRAAIDAARAGSATKAQP